MKKKITHLLLLDSYGGVENWYLDLAKNNFFDKQYDTIYAIGKTKNAAVINALSNYVNVITVPITSFLRLFFFFLENKKQIKSQDFVYSHGYYRSVTVIVLFKLFSKAKIVTHNHSAAFDSIKSIKMKCFAFLAGRIIRLLTNKKVAVSKKAARDLFGTTKGVKLISCYLKKYENIEQRQKPEYDGKRIIQLLHIGRFYDSKYFLSAKNQHFLIDVLHWLENLDVKYRMVFCGNGDIKEVKEKMALLGIEEDKVQFIPFIEPLELFYESDLFLFPSNHEGYGLALVEAQLSGTSCIVSPQIPEEAILNEEMVETLSIGEEDAKEWALRIKNYEAKSQVPKIKLTSYEEHIHEVKNLFS